MEAGQGLDEGRPGPGPARLGHPAGGPIVADDVPLDEGHHVERCPVDRVVHAQAQGRGNRHPGRSEGTEDGVLALHVVGGGEDVADRWSAEGEGTAGVVGDPVGQVGAPTGDQLEGQRWIALGNRRRHPRGDPFVVDALDADVGSGWPCFHALDATRLRSGAGRHTPGWVRPPGIVVVMIDVTDATFEEEVLRRSLERPVVVDLWAPWCGPCQTLGPVIERVVDATEGAVALVKVNIDENPVIAGSFQVQSIPAVFALKDGKVVDAFIGAQPEDAVAEFVAKLTPAPSEADLLVDEGLRAGTEEPLRKALELEPDHEGAISALAAMMITAGDTDGAIALLGRIPETPQTRLLLAEARLASQQVDVDGADIDALLDGLLDRVRDDDAARQEFLDLLETLGPEDPRTNEYRKALSARLF